MREVQVTLPELALLVGIRTALGAGLGLFLADCLPGSQRKAAGWKLLMVGGDHHTSRVRAPRQGPLREAVLVAVVGLVERVFGLLGGY